jgi:hypothetical protein
MIEQMRNPPVGFEVVVRTHFFLRKDAILRETEVWVEGINAAAAATADKRPAAAATRVRFQRMCRLCSFFSSVCNKFYMLDRRSSAASAAAGAATRAGKVAAAGQLRCAEFRAVGLK